MWIRRAKRAKQRSVCNNFVLSEAVFEWLLSFFCILKFFPDEFSWKASKTNCFEWRVFESLQQCRLDENQLQDETSPTVSLIHQCCARRPNRSVWRRPSVFPKMWIRRAKRAKHRSVRYNFVLLEAVFWVNFKFFFFLHSQFFRMISSKGFKTNCFETRFLKPSIQPRLDESERDESSQCCTRWLWGKVSFHDVNKVSVTFLSSKNKLLWDKGFLKASNSVVWTKINCRTRRVQLCHWCAKVARDAQTEASDGPSVFCKMWIRRAKRAKQRSVCNNFVLSEAVFEWLLSFFCILKFFPDEFSWKASKTNCFEWRVFESLQQCRLDENQLQDETSPTVSLIHQCCARRPNRSVWRRPSVFPKMWIRRAKRAKHRSVRYNFVLLEAVFWVNFKFFFFCILNFSEWFLRKASKQIALKQGFWNLLFSLVWMNQNETSPANVARGDFEAKCLSTMWTRWVSHFCLQKTNCFETKGFWKPLTGSFGRKSTAGRDESNCVIDVPKLRATPKTNAKCLSKMWVRRASKTPHRSV